MHSLVLIIFVKGDYFPITKRAVILFRPVFFKVGLLYACPRSFVFCIITLDLLNLHNKCLCKTATLSPELCDSWVHLTAGFLSFIMIAYTVWAYTTTSTSSHFKLLDRYLTQKNPRHIGNTSRRVYYIEIETCRPTRFASMCTERTGEAIASHL